MRQFSGWIQTVSSISSPLSDVISDALHIAWSIVTPDTTPVTVVTDELERIKQLHTKGTGPFGITAGGKPRAAILCFFGSDRRLCEESSRLLEVFLLPRKLHWLHSTLALRKRNG